MHCVAYKFNEIKMLKQKSYINQCVTGRKMSNVYHTHDFYEFIIITEGSCVQLIDGIEYDLNKDSFVLLCPETAHAVLGQSDDVFAVSISVEKEEFEQIANMYNIELLKKLI